MKPMLLLEDDNALAGGLLWSLSRNGFALEHVSTLKKARERLQDPGRYCLLLDVTLPDGSGFSLCRQVRGRDSRIPFLLLTASDEEVSVIQGLDSGGDDSITKPFRLGELCSRIRALLRRSGTEARPDPLLCGPLTLDLAGCRPALEGRPLSLTATEYRLLSPLVRNANQTLPRKWILERLWASKGSFVDGNTLSVYIRRLQEKVEEDPFHPRRLFTVRGFGYLWKEERP